jgi:hypothetical protein
MGSIAHIRNNRKTNRISRPIVAHEPVLFVLKEVPLDFLPSLLKR